MDNCIDGSGAVVVPLATFSPKNNDTGEDIESLQEPPVAEENPRKSAIPCGEKSSSRARRASIIQSIKTPEDTLHAIYQAGVYKAKQSWDQLALQAFMAGIFIAGGAIVSVTRWWCPRRNFLPYWSRRNRLDLSRTLYG